MRYFISNAAYGRMFGVPTDVVDRHIRLAGAVQLKVLLCLLAHPDQAADPAGLAEMLSLPQEDLADAMQYWIGVGLVRDGDAPMEEPSSRPEPVQQEKEPPSPLRRGTRRARSRSAGAPAQRPGPAPVPPARPRPWQRSAPGRHFLRRGPLSPPSLRAAPLRARRRRTPCPGGSTAAASA